MSKEMTRKEAVMAMLDGEKVTTHLGSKSYMFFHRGGFIYFNHYDQFIFRFSD